MIRNKPVLINTRLAPQVPVVGKERKFYITDFGTFFYLFLGSATDCFYFWGMLSLSHRACVSARGCFRNPGAGPCEGEDQYLFHLFLVFAVGRTFPVIFCARAIQGIGSSCITVAGKCSMSGILLFFLSAAVLVR